MVITLSVWYTALRATTRLKIVDYSFNESSLLNIHKNLVKLRLEQLHEFLTGETARLHTHRCLELSCIVQVVRQNEPCLPYLKRNCPSPGRM